MKLTICKKIVLVMCSTIVAEPVLCRTVKFCTEDKYVRIWWKQNRKTYNLAFLYNWFQLFSFLTFILPFQITFCSILHWNKESQYFETHSTMPDSRLPWSSNLYSSQYKWPSLKTLKSHNFSLGNTIFLKVYVHTQDV